MLRFRTQRLAIVAGLASIALLPTTALAASSATESISGVETGIPTACGPSGSGDSKSSFAGTASGTINGVWSASVCHSEPSVHGVTATISGGSYRVSGFVHWRYVSTSGTFTGGSVGPGIETDYVIHGVGTCTQVFAVTITGTGTFNATLEHYGAYFNNSCHVLSATLKGTGHITY
jgi:hypothetical protein